MLSLVGSVNETRAYNSRLQLTRLSAPHMTCSSYWTCINDGADYTYTYSADQNNGRIVQQTDNSSGEQVTYQYDELNRLISAVRADTPSVPQWGQAFLYDGFGNLTDKSVIKGSAPVWHGLVDPATNRASGYTYDANGNAVSPNFQNGYDVENRLASATAWVQSSQYLYNYGYDPDNRKMCQVESIHDASTGGYNLVGETITFWSPMGQRMGSYTLIATEGGPGYAPTLSFRWGGEWAYFGKRLIWAGGAVYTDRLGSVGRFFPYGEDRTGNSWGGIFATYFPDSVTGWKYAINRHYDPGTGTFLTADPYRANTGGPGDLAEPGSWNRYGYVLNNSINFNDPRGLTACDITGNNCDDSVTVNGDTGAASWSDVMRLPLPGNGSDPPAYLYVEAERIGRGSIPEYLDVGAQAHVPCDAVPDGRTMSLNGALGILGGVAVSAEVVLDYHTGQATLVVSAGFGPSGAAAQVGVSSGFIWGAGDSVPQYASGGNSTVSASLPSRLGVSITSNSGGLTGNPTVLAPLAAMALQIGYSVGLVSLTGGFAAVAQNTIKQISLGSFVAGPAALLSAPPDLGLYSFYQKACR